MHSPASNTDVCTEGSRCNFYRPTLFQMCGRLNRSRFLLYFIILFLAYIAHLPLVITLPNISESKTFFSFHVLSIVLGLPFTAMGAILCIRRLNDFNASGWWVLAYLFPFTVYLLFLALLLVPGTRGVNRYGVSPIRSSTTVKTLFALILMLAAGALTAVAVILNEFSNGYYW